MEIRRTWLIGLFLGLAVLLLLAGPASLLWTEFRPQPWDWRTLRVHFESARYETAAFIFTYRIENRAHHSLRLLPEVTQIRARQAFDQPPRGYPSLYLPLDLDAKSSQLIEIRFDIASSKFRLPAQASSAPPESPVDSTLADLDGFELINPNKGLRLVFPRGW